MPRPNWVDYVRKKQKRRSEVFVQEELVVSTSPHIFSRDSVNRIMWDVAIALVPAFMASVYFFGLAALRVMVVTIVSALVTEALILRFKKAPVTINDGSAFITGMLLAFVLPPGIPLWMAALGGVIAISIAKQAFGGLGCNIFNPALVARAVLLISWPVAMTTWRPPRSIPFDALTYATPLGILKESLQQVLPSYRDIFIGNVGGCIGETSVLALLIGAAYLLYRRHITWHIPLTFVGTVALLTWAFGGDELFSGNFLLHLLAGGLILGAFFMATDPVTSPVTKKGRIIMGLGCGLITVLIRLKGGPPEGVSFSILLMNALTPIIDFYTKPRKLGGRRR